MIPNRNNLPNPLTESCARKAIPAAAIAGNKAKAATTPTKVSVFCLTKAANPEIPAAMAAMTLYQPGLTRSSLCLLGNFVNGVL